MIDMNNIDRIEISDKKRNARRRLEEISEVGRRVFDSEIFKKGRTQTHHGTSTVGYHTFEVADSALRICDYLRNRGISINRREVIIGALCHDLGIIGRHEKFRNNIVCSQQHPRDSVKEAQKLFYDMSPKMKKIIGRHMWPITPMWPTSREGWVVNLADKIATFNDLLHPGHGMRAVNELTETIYGIDKTNLI